MIVTVTVESLVSLLGVLWLQLVTLTAYIPAQLPQLAFRVYFEQSFNYPSYVAMFSVMLEMYLLYCNQMKTLR